MTAKAIAAVDSGLEQCGYKEGDRVITEAAFDRQQHVGVIVAVRSTAKAGTQCFVHFEDCTFSPDDKRCDEWIPVIRLVPHTEELANEIAVRPSQSVDEDEHVRGGRRKRARLTSGVLPALDNIEADADEEHKKAHPLKARYTEEAGALSHADCPVYAVSSLPQPVVRHGQGPRAYVEYGAHELKTWYFSPYPPEFSSLERIFVCPFTMKYFRKRRQLEKHLSRLSRAQRQPPGERIYTSPLPNSTYPLSTPDCPQITPACDPQICVYEVDGAKAKLYCQNLCLLTKLFLDGKTLVWEVHEFMFYVVCEKLPGGDEMVGYFSREKKSEINHLACILTLPHKQRCGYGGFIIDFSYELARRRERPGTPERPFSDLGEAAFKEYWERTLVAKLAQVPQKQTINLNDLAVQTGIMKEDILLAIGEASRVRELRLCKYVQQQWHAEVKDYHALMELFDLVRNGKRRLIVDEASLTWVCETPRRGRG